MAAPDDGEEWRFTLDDLDEEAGADAEAEGGAGRGGGEETGNVAGALSPAGPVTPGDIDPENAFFVLVGMLIAGLFVGAIVAAL